MTLSTFHERLDHMERTRNERCSLLQAEKELQANKSQVLGSKLANIRTMEQKCLILNQKIASQKFKILAYKSEMENMDMKYEACLHELRSLQSKIQELEELEKKKDSFYEAKRLDMIEFKENVDKFVADCQMKVQNTRNRVNELKSIFIALKSNNKDSCNSEIAAAEMRRSELQALKDNLDRKLASKYEIKTQLQKQLQNILMTQTRV
ncbi:hypothetical protein L6164_035495 [Bauhinia variegata]|uniref:Uncharacterized protein n=1 Tax=Bauhinia variegata TaxID=167791 RepID=A0ACB9KE44_BAUVA|nr:hypothetical protein L6164_035495 [Bauhinia variegata]